MSMRLQNPEEIKVFILYLMERIGYPLSYTDIGSIVIRDGVTDYFAFFEQFDDLLRSGHVAEVDENGEPVPGLPRDDEEAADPAKMYVITKSGKLIADALSENHRAPHAAGRPALRPRVGCRCLQRGLFPPRRPTGTGLAHACRHPGRQQPLQPRPNHAYQPATRQQLASTIIPDYITCEYFNLVNSSR